MLEALPNDVPPPALTGDSLEQHRPAVTSLCRRMLGPGPAAEDAAQETIVRAWRRSHQFHGDGPLAAWVQRIARNVCLDELTAAGRRPQAWGDVGDLRDATGVRSAWTREGTDDLGSADPAALVQRVETARLACTVALRVLPARQRAVLVLCVVLRVPAGEAATLMGTSTASVNSLLQRARATLAAEGATPEAVDPVLGAEQRALLARYVAALTTADVEALVALALDELRAVPSTTPRSLAA